MTEYGVLCTAFLSWTQNTRNLRLTTRATHIVRWTKTLRQNEAEGRHKEQGELGVNFKCRLLSQCSVAYKHFVLFRTVRHDFDAIIMSAMRNGIDSTGICSHCTNISCVRARWKNAHREKFTLRTRESVVICKMDGGCMANAENRECLCTIVVCDLAADAYRNEIADSCFGRLQAPNRCWNGHNSSICWGRSTAGCCNVHNEKEQSSDLITNGPHFFSLFYLTSFAAQEGKKETKRVKLKIELSRTERDRSGDHRIERTMPMKWVPKYRKIHNKQRQHPTQPQQQTQ